MKTVSKNDEQRKETFIQKERKRNRAKFQEKERTKNQ